MGTISLKTCTNCMRASFFLAKKKKKSFDERQMAWSPSWECFSLYFLSKSQLHIGQTEPCCSPSAWHVKQQSVCFLPETSPVWRPLNTRSHQDNYAEHHFSTLHILAGHKEQQLIPVIAWEGTKTMFMSCTSDHNLWLMLKDCLSKGWPVGRCLFRWYLPVNIFQNTREIQSLPIIQPAKTITVNLSSETKSNLFNDSSLLYTRPINGLFGSPCLQSLM